MAKLPISEKTNRVWILWDENAIKHTNKDFWVRRKNRGLTNGRDAKQLKPGFKRLITVFKNVKTLEKARALVLRTNFYNINKAIYNDNEGKRYKIEIPTRKQINQL